MSVEKLERVLWRIRKRNPNNPNPSNLELKRAIMIEIGTDMRTYYSNRKALIGLNWIRSKGTGRITLTDKDLTE